MAPSNSKQKHGLRTEFAVGAGVRRARDGQRCTMMAKAKAKATQ